MSETGLEFTRNQRLAICAIVGMTLIGISVGLYRRSVCPDVGNVVFRDASAAVTSGNGSFGADKQKLTTVVFQVAGYVNAPGVYSLHSDCRVVDAIKAAGGAKESADLESINLAAHIEDGSRIYVPAINETQGSPGDNLSHTTARVSEHASSRGSQASASKLRSPGEGTVNINTADEDELQRLPGVGPATARKIIDYRSQAGRFQNPEQLIEVKGIGPKTFERMRPFVRI